MRRNCAIRRFGTLLIAFSGLAVATPAIAHSPPPITAAVVYSGPQDGIYGPLCAEGGLNAIDHNSNGWTSQSGTALKVGWGCNENPINCCVAGQIRLVMDTQRANGTYCTGATFWAANSAGSSGFIALNNNLCGAPASGSKRTTSIHQVDLYTPNHEAGLQSPIHANI